MAKQTAAEKAEEELRLKAIGKAREKTMCGGHALEADDIEIDEDARISTGGDGTWVQAWIHIPKEDFETDAEG